MTPSKVVVYVDEIMLNLSRNRHKNILPAPRGFLHVKLKDHFKKLFLNSPKVV